MSPLQRANNLRIMLSDDEKRMLQAIADDEGLTSSDVLRQFIRREHAIRFTDGLGDVERDILRLVQKAEDGLTREELESSLKELGHDPRKHSSVGALLKGLTKLRELLVLRAQRYYLK